MIASSTGPRSARPTNAVIEVATPRDRADAARDLLDVDAGVRQGWWHQTVLRSLVSSVAAVPSSQGGTARIVRSERVGRDLAERDAMRPELVEDALPAVGAQLERPDAAAAADDRPHELVRRLVGADDHEVGAVAIDQLADVHARLVLADDVEVRLAPECFPDDLA